MLEKVNDITTSENVMKVVQEFEKVIMNKKKQHMADLPSRTNISKV